ncbi:hypothetical protein JJB09_12185 [Rhizobium sp. KVB221]|uniref:Calcium-binding protein n=1 Tax=Rhizobium setariae TaxID=2801340 RepID=A0A936YLU4_9HYPH|nr:calcium-binding protein [Rhizobium setariae]MBL0372790.1 hypothetical protein [Rhizobium setariae]
MASTMITIDASEMSSVNYQEAIAAYFKPLGTTAGTSSWYGGIPYADVTQVGFRFGGTTNNGQVLIEGSDLAYDGSTHAITGNITGFTLGYYDETTTSTVIDPVTGEVSELQNVIPGLVISGLDITAAAGSGLTNPVNALYGALRKANDATSGATYIQQIYDLLAAQAQHFIGSAGDDVYTGTAFADLIEGNDGNDTLDGGAGADTMIGGLGNDTYIVDNLGDVTTEAADGGIDTVRVSVDHYDLKANVENLTMTGTADLWGYGNELDNILTGNSGNNTLMGMGGNDTMIGGLGNDTYYVADAGDVVVEQAGEGTDTVRTGLDNYVLGANIENLTLSGTANLTGTGNGLDNVLTGNAGNNTLYGLAGNDTLDGKAGADTMVGGTGDDTYVVDDAGDVVTELDGEGTDTVKTALDAYTLGAFVENLILTGTADLVGNGNALNNVITGNSGANTLYGFAGDDTLDGGAGADTLVGGIGNDTYIVDNAGDVVTELAGEGTDTVITTLNHYPLGAFIENLTLAGSDDLFGYGNELDNVLTGNDGKNFLAGLGGNDTYVVGKGDTVTELTQGGADAGGIDLVKASVSFTLANFIENLTLTGSGNFNGTGNSLANTLNGNSGNNTLLGLGGNDKINGGAGNDILKGDVGKDILKGGAGNDKIYGGAGQDDLYGNGGADTFFFASGDTSAAKAKADTIFDFNGKQGDHINLAGIDANEGRKGDQAFSFIGTDKFSGDAGELRFQQIKGETYVFGDTDGDKKADFAIHFDDAINFKADFFVL